MYAFFSHSYIDIETLLQKEFDMDKINDFLNHKLPKNFLYDDDLVIDKLEACIERISRHKFIDGGGATSGGGGGVSVLEPPPASELPKIPFGEFKKCEKQDIIAQLVRNQVDNKETDREQLVGKLAQDRLELERKKIEEVKRRKRDEKRAAAANDNNNVSLT